MAKKVAVKEFIVVKISEVGYFDGKSPEDAVINYSECFTLDEGEYVYAIPAEILNKYKFEFTKEPTVTAVPE